MIDRKHLYAGAALGLVAAAALGFGTARVLQPAVTNPAAAASPAPGPASKTSLVVTPQTIVTSQITVAPAAAGELDAALLAAATVEALPDAEAVLTARAPGTVSRIFKRIGDRVQAGEIVALVESREASQIAADRAAAAARMTLAARQLNRERTLLDQGVSPRADFEAAQANYAVASAETRRAAAAASTARLSRDGRSVAVTSPITGHVTGATARLGQFVAAETELFRASDPRRLQIAASLPADQASRVRVGDRVELIVGSAPPVAGRVRAVTGVVDPQTRAMIVAITPAAGVSALSPGQMVQARIFASGAAVAHGVMVPQDAVQTMDGRDVVFVRTRDGFRTQPVRVGSRSAGMVGIAEGIAAGDMIATGNAFLLKAELEKDAGGEE